MQAPLHPDGGRVANPALSPAAGWRPRVSVVLPIRNEADHIEVCLERLLQQDYPTERLEILVIDGCSDDATREAVQGVQERYPDARVRLLHNPQRTVPPALNIGIRAASGTVIVRMDGHTVPAPDYVSRCVDVLARSGAANVGGVIEPEGPTPFGQAVAIASSHWLGAGDAKYRIGGTAGDVDTVPFGAFRREAFERVGLFDESMVRDQDYEFNVRLRTAGERVHLDPAIRSRYTTRGTARGLWRQYLQYGWWKGETWRRHLASFRWRQLGPPAFVAGLLILAVAGPWSSLAALGLVSAATVYLATVAAIAWPMRRPQASFTHIALAFLIMHVAYGLGVLLWAISLGRFPYRARAPDVPRLDATVHEPSGEVNR